MENILKVYVNGGGNLIASEEKTLYGEAASPVASPVRYEYDDMMMQWFLYFSNPGSYLPDCTGGSGIYEFSVSITDEENFIPNSYPPFLPTPGEWYCKVRDKYEPSNVANCTPYPLAIS